MGHGRWESATSLGTRCWGVRGPGYKARDAAQPAVVCTGSPPVHGSTVLQFVCLVFTFSNWCDALRMHCTLTDLVMGRDAPLRAVGDAAFAGEAEDIVAAVGPPDGHRVARALVVVSAQEAWLSGPGPELELAMGEAAGLVIVGNDDQAEAITACVPVAVPISGAGDARTVTEDLLRHVANAATARAGRMAELARRAADAASSDSPPTRLTQWVGQQVDAPVDLILADADIDQQKKEWSESPLSALRTHTPLILNGDHPARLALPVTRDDSDRLLLAERNEPWTDEDIAFLKAAAAWLGAIARIDDAHGTATRWAQATRDLRSEGVRRIVSGDVPSGKRLLRPLVQGSLFDRRSVIVAVVEAAPTEGAATLAADIDQAAHGLALTVPMAEWPNKPKERPANPRHIMVITPVDTLPRPEDLLRRIVARHPSRFAGSAPATDWRRLSHAIRTAESALDKARTAPDRVVVGDPRAPLPDVLGDDAAAWAAQLAKSLVDVVSDDDQRKDLLGIVELTQWLGTKETAKYTGRTRDAVQNAAIRLATAVDLDRTNLWHSAVIYLMIRLSALPTPRLVGKKEVSLEEVLRNPRAIEWAEAMLKPLDPAVRRTLSTWLLNGRSPDATAAAIGVHRKTVYRHLSTAMEATGWRLTRRQGARDEATLSMLITDSSFYDRALKDERFRQIASPRPRAVVAREGQMIINSDIPHTARVYDFFLGGTTNFPADREFAQEILASNPTVELACRTSRDWILRATKWAARRARQFIDVGTGIPTSPNLHECAQSIDRRSRVVYIDHDPIVLRHAESLLESTEEGATAYLEADFYDGPRLLDIPAVQEVIDLSQPVVLCLNNILHFVADDRAYDIVAGLVGRLVPGSMLMLTQVTSEFDPDKMREVENSYTNKVTPAKARSREEFEAFFADLDLVPPGIVPPAEWRPEPGTEIPDRKIINALAAVGVVPPKRN